MVKRLGGSRHKTRYKLQKPAGQSGRVRITAYFQQFSVGDAVALTLDSSVHKGTYHPRHYGKTGTVTGTQGSSYAVRINDNGKEKTVLAHPVHLRRV